MFLHTVVAIPILAPAQSVVSTTAAPHEVGRIGPEESKIGKYW